MIASNALKDACGGLSSGKIFSFFQNDNVFAPLLKSIFPRVSQALDDHRHSHHSFEKLARRATTADLQRLAAGSGDAEC